ncbi:hypothetical protein PMI42_06239 [Bradyrhizobium sp. YR681]|uniref:hypothetical protein n=1 Tax=Bradyrhizobium sp. YR681 TaxID=1144344 RepID=UPI00026FB9F5|nr:hypothetical protein [Bradyrhizobium sp. YR681]EJN10463.1 hypothetical protein PMI42_06239 [Bradyrhizobium sp. YR681]
MKLSDITTLQWIGIVILFNTTLLGGAGQLGDLSLSPGMVKAVLAVATLGNGFLGGLVTMFGGQGSMIKTVAAMPGIEQISVNSQANQTLAQIATSGAADAAKVEATPAAQRAVGQTARGAAAIAVLLLAGFFAFAGDAHAQTQVRKALTGNIIADIKANSDAGSSGGLSGRASVGLSDILGALDAKLLPDLQYALKLANASGSKVTAPCYQAWIDIITVRQKAVTDDSGNPLPMPDPALISNFEKMVELRNALQPDSDFMIKCSPVASMVKKDITGFIGLVISGGAGLATLVPGL